MARIGVIGAGQAGARQAGGFAACRDVKIVGVADIDEERARSLALQYGAVATRDWRELFALGLDVLVVATPHNGHVAPAQAAALHSVHLMMEKPIATNLDDASRILEVAEAGTIKMTVSFVHRHREEVKRAYAWRERVGSLQFARETMSGSRTANHPRWLTSKAVAGGGVLMYSAIHGVDRLRWFFGADPVEVVARSRRYAPDNSEVEDGIAMLMTFPDGNVASLDANAPAYRSVYPVWETEFHGDCGMMRIRTRQFFEASSDSAVDRYVVADDPETAFELYPFQRQAQDFIDSISNNREPLVSGADGFEALRICLAAYESAATGKPVTLQR